MKTRTETHEVLTHEDYATALEVGAAETMAMDPAGPEYWIVRFNPGQGLAPQKPRSIAKLTMSNLAIQSTYCLTAKLTAGMQNPLVLRNYMFSDAMHSGDPYIDVGPPVVAQIPVEQLDWRTAYRTSQPEIEPVKLAALAGRLKAQEAYKKGLTGYRHSTRVQQIINDERSRARARAKQKRIRDLLRGDDSGSDSASSVASD
jgi:hypothetical protein